MEDARLEEYRRHTRLREQEDLRRARKVAADLRLQSQERQAQDEAHQAEVPPAEDQRYAQLPRTSYTGIR
ncbi:hypothetical protein [Streptomyces sp. NPDC007088]|uniref:hypothetical protein n=1 Tax=Streptomyces sp. NPDC007088 TaxID=3364773 RepID=UPI0036CF3A1E